MFAQPHATKVLIVYYSRFGVVQQLAEEIAAGVGQLGDTVAELLAVDETPVEQLRPGEDMTAMGLRRAVMLNTLADADAIVIGSPAYFGNMASPLKRLFEDCAVASDPAVADRTRPWHGQRFRDKVGAAFTASATPHGGNEQALHSMLTLMMHLGMIVVTPGQQEPILENDAAPYGATAIAGADGDQMPDASTREQARTLGQRVAEIATWLRDGRTAWEQQHAAPHHARAAPAKRLALGRLPRP